jgi:hypothetical protein
MPSIPTTALGLVFIKILFDLVEAQGPIWCCPLNIFWWLDPR